MKNPSLPQNLGDNSMLSIAVIANSTFQRLGIISQIEKLKTYKVMLDAENVTAFQKKILQIKVPPDICILDMYKIGGNIYKVIKTLKKQIQNLRILVLSSCNNILGLIKLVEVGADGYLFENSESMELQLALSGLDKQGMYLPNKMKDIMIAHYKNMANGNVSLTDRELEFLSYCTQELTYKEIAEKIFISPRTVDKISRDLFEKVGVSSRTSLALFAVEIGLYEYKNNI